MAETPLFIDRETIRLTREGVFLSDGEEITHGRTVDAYHRFLGRDDEGYFIAIGRDFKRIEVEDTASFVAEIDWAPGDESIELTLRDGTRQTLDPETVRYRADRLTCQIRRPDGRTEEAKFLRKPYLEFLLHALDDKSGYHVRIGSKTIRLGPSSA
jgi:hypothetical protein